MKYLIIIAAVVLFTMQDLHGQSYREIDEKELLELTGRKNDTTYVVNFWATWCSPCVKEIGYFESLYRNTREDKVHILLVSLDFPNQAEKRVTPFLEEKKITAPVALMTNIRYNDWIDKVDPAWSGAIPATLIFRNGKRVFLEKELTEAELVENVNQIMN